MFDLPIIELIVFFSQYIPEMMLGLSLIICLILTPSLTRERAIDFSLSVLLFLNVGVTGISGFILPTFFTPLINQVMAGAMASPYEWQVAIANLGLGVTGFVAFGQNFTFRLAVIINTTCFLWGTAAFQLYQRFGLSVVTSNHTSVYPNIIVPTLFWLLIAFRSRD